MKCSAKIYKKTLFKYLTSKFFARNVFKKDKILDINLINEKQEPNQNLKKELSNLEKYFKYFY